jgi:fluoride exporter
MEIFWIALFGVAGVLCRYGIDNLIPSVNFPWSTWTINLLGAFFAGLLFASPASPFLKIPMMVGFLGGFTTFSAYSLQSLLLIEQGAIGNALLYFLGSPICGLAMAWLGIFAARSFLFRG